MQTLLYFYFLRSSTANNVSDKRLIWTLTTDQHLPINPLERKMKNNKKKKSFRLENPFYCLLRVCNQALFVSRLAYIMYLAIHNIILSIKPKHDMSYNPSVSNLTYWTTSRQYSLVWIWSQKRLHRHHVTLGPANYLVISDIDIWYIYEWPQNCNNFPYKICTAKFAQKISVNFLWKTPFFPQIWLWKTCEIWSFSMNYQKPCIVHEIVTPTCQLL